jgi:hypothetical protein
MTRLAIDFATERDKGYLPIGRQLDMLWHDIDDGSIKGKDSTWYKHIKMVKEKYPKETLNGN